MPSMKESIHEMKQQCYKSFEKQDSSHNEAPVVFVSDNGNSPSLRVHSSNVGPHL